MRKFFANLKWSLKMRVRAAYWCFRYDLPEKIRDFVLIFTLYWPLNVLYLVNLDRAYVRKHRPDLEIDQNMGEYHFESKFGSGGHQVIRLHDIDGISKFLGGIKFFREKREPHPWLRHQKKDKLFRS